MTGTKHKKTTRKYGSIGQSLTCAKRQATPSKPTKLPSKIAERYPKMTRVSCGNSTEAPYVVAKVPIVDKCPASMSVVGFVK